MDDTDAARLATEIALLHSTMDTVLTPEQAAALARIQTEEIRSRLREAHERDAEAWARVENRAHWKAFRDERIAALARSLGDLPRPRAAPEAMVTGSIQGEGFRIENVVFAGRPGLPVTANLYLPDPVRPPMPAVIICPSHHNPKTHTELQDMGMTWARAGAAVLVSDNLGHGERRQQPFGGREDYHSRYVLGMQLYVVGESLMGFFAADLIRAVDFLCARPDVDAERIVLLGSVAGGGDPAAVAAALDGRIACSIPFNFGAGSMMPGGPAEPEPALNLAGGGDWESTRALRLSARDGFLPWVIVAATAPRPLVFAKEFGFDPDTDAAYARLRKVYAFYGADDRLASVRAWSVLSHIGSSGVYNVGAPHRAQIYPLLERWLEMPIPREYQRRVDADSLICMTPEAATRFNPRTLHEVAAEIGAERLAAARAARSELAPAARAAALRREWSRLLGDAESITQPHPRRFERLPAGPIITEKHFLVVAPGIALPTVLLLPAGGEGPPRPMVVCVSQQGKGRFLTTRAREIAGLVRRGIAVCLFDPRGTGETRPGEGRGYERESISLASLDLKLGRTTLGLRVRDLRTVLRYLRNRGDLDQRRIGLWGDSFAAANHPNLVAPPRETECPPRQAEPLGQLLALLGALFEEDVQAVVARGGLVSFASILAGRECYVPLDAVVPGMLTVGDVADLVAALAPRSVCVDGLVDGRNCIESDADMAAAFAPAREAYKDAEERLRLSPDVGADTAEWLASALISRDLPGRCPRREHPGIGR